MKFKLAKAIVTASLLCITLSSCDINKNERQSEQKKLENIASETEKLRIRIEEIDRSISQKETEIKEARDDLKTNNSEYEKNKLELAKYSMDHKLAAVAAAVSAGGVAALFSDLEQDQKAAIAAPTAIALGYCLMYREECSEVSARIAYFGAQITFFKNKISDAENREKYARQKIHSYEQERRPLKFEFAELSTKLETLRERIKSLECPFPICF